METGFKVSKPIFGDAKAFAKWLTVPLANPPILQPITQEPVIYIRLFVICAFFHFPLRLTSSYFAAGAVLP